MRLIDVIIIGRRWICNVNFEIVKDRGELSVMFKVVNVGDVNGFFMFI